MKQVLLSTVEGNRRPPTRLWMDDCVGLGDVFLWRGRLCTVSAVYGTHFSTGTEARKTERPHRNQQAGIVLDHHAGSN